MIISSWRYTATATLARSTALPVADHSHVSVVNINTYEYGIVARVAKSGWRRWALHLAVLGLGAKVLVGCAGQPVPPPPETAAVSPPQPAVPKPPSHVARRPAHKPLP